MTSQDISIFKPSLSKSWLRSYFHLIINLLNTVLELKSQCSMVSNVH